LQDCRKLTLGIGITKVDREIPGLVLQGLAVGLESPHHGTEDQNLGGSRWNSPQGLKKEVYPLVRKKRAKKKETNGQTVSLPTLPSGHLHPWRKNPYPLCQKWIVCHIVVTQKPRRGEQEMGQPEYLFHITEAVINALPGRKLSQALHTPLTLSGPGADLSLAVDKVDAVTEIIEIMQA
jgi:hypothetical protein